MEVFGVDNKNTINFNIDKKVYYSFLNTPLDKVQISSQNSEQKDNTQNKELKEVKDLLDPKKNYKRLTAQIAGIAGASVLILGLTMAALFRGNSGFAEKMGNFLQKRRGEIYSLQHENSMWAKIRLSIKKNIVHFFEKGLTTWVNTEQFRNRFLDQKIIEKLGVFKKPIEWTVTKFENLATKASQRKYNKCVEKARELEKLLPDLIKMAPEREEKIRRTVSEIIEETEKLAGNLNERKKFTDCILTKLAKSYDEEYDILSKQGGFREVIKHIFHDAKGLAKSGDKITSRKNLEELKEEKAGLYEKKEKISRNIKDNYERNMDLLKQAEDSIIEASKGDKNLERRYTDDFFNSIRILEDTIKKYKNSETIRGKNARKTSKNLFIEDVNSLIKELKSYKNEKFDRAIESLEKAKNRIGTEDKKGSLEELRELLKCYDEKTGRNIAKDQNKEPYERFKKATDELSKSLNKAVEFESDNLVYRLMDLKLGGGNLEVLGLSVPIGFGVYNIAQADSHDERVSKGIRTTSVIGGGIAGWIISGVVLCLSAGPAILAGLGGGLLFNQVGKFIDNKFWSHGKDWDAIKKQKQQEATVAYKA